MNFELSQEQQLLADSLKRFVTNDYSFDARTKIVASPRGWSEDVWAAIAEMGLMGLPFPAEHDGFGGTRRRRHDRHGGHRRGARRGAVPGHRRPRRPVRGARGDARAAEAAPARHRAGPAAAWPSPTPSAGARYDLAQVGLRARREGDGFVLDGDKRVVLHGAAADVLVVSARTAGGDTDAARRQPLPRGPDRARA